MTGFCVSVKKDGKGKGMMQKTRKAKDQTVKVITFSDLGEKVDRIQSPLERKGDGTWVHYSERRVVEPLDEKLIRQEEHARLHEALNRLDPEDRDLIIQRYGIEGDAKTLEELGRARGIGKEAIRLRIEKIQKELKKKLSRL